MDYKCWELPQNAEYRPQNWKSKMGQETANVACDNEAGPGIELLLSSVDEARHQQNIHLKPNIWIADTAATVHMSPHDSGMVSMKKISSVITVGNGEKMKVDRIGDIPCEICDKYGKAVNIALLTDVTVTKTSPYNLFSITKMMKLGWTLGGDVGSGIKMTKGNQVLKFDYPIKTTKGVVYAMCINRITASQVLPDAIKCKEIEYKKKFQLTQSALPDKCDLNTEPRMKNSMNVYGIEVPEDEDQCEVTVLEDKNKCVEVIRVNEERSESKETELNEEYRDNPIETAVGTTRSGIEFADGKEFGMHFDPGPNHDSIFVEVEVERSVRVHFNSSQKMNMSEDGCQKVSTSERNVNSRARIT
jgi:hypothetical protein